MKHILIFACLFTAGCGGGGRAPLASGEEAHQALETALKAWQEHKAPGLVAEQPKTIQAIDFQWSAGQELASYVIQPEEPSEGARVFPVKLTMKKPAGDQETRYMVFGGGPIFVYRSEDYQRMVNMENDPSTAQRKRR